MIRHRILIATATGGIVQTIVRATDRADAIRRAEAAYPGGTVAECKRMDPYTEADA